MNKKDICSYNYDELKEEMLAIGEKAFRSKQIYEWLHVKLADDFDEMTNLSKAFPALAHFVVGYNMFPLHFDLADNNQVLLDRLSFRYQNRSLLFISFFVDGAVLLRQFKHKFGCIFAFTLRPYSTAVHFNHHLYYIKTQSCTFSIKAS